MTISDNNITFRQVIKKVYDSTLTALKVSIQAGTALIGKVSIDQTTPGTTNNVAVTGMGEVQASPTANTLLARIKDLLTGIALAAGSARIGTVSGVLKTVSVTKVLVGGACSAKDVLSEHITTGTSWLFAAIARENGGKGYIVKALAICETASITPRLILFLFNAVPTCNLNDNVANTALLHADLAKFIGWIEFPAMESTPVNGDSKSVAVPGSPGMPLAFECAAGADDIYGVLVAVDAVTPGAADDMTIQLTAEQY